MDDSGNHSDHASPVTTIEGVGLPAGMSWLLSCARACAERAGVTWDRFVLAGLFGHAFESTWGVGGAEVWSGCSLEWYRHERGLGRLGLARDRVDLVANHPESRAIPSDEERREALERAYGLVVNSIERGVPALVWSPMSTEQRDSGLTAFGWGLVEGVNRVRKEYLVLHPAAGRSTVRFDLLGRVDPVEWLSVHVFLEPDAECDPAADARAAITDAVEILSGETPAADRPAPAEQLRHGVPAFAAWADEAVAEDTRSAAARKALYWSGGRSAGAAFCDWAADALPDSGAALADAATTFREQSLALAQVASGAADASTAAKRAAELQSAALACLRATQA